MEFRHARVSLESRPRGEGGDILIPEKYHERAPLVTLRKDSFGPEPWDRGDPRLHSTLSFAPVQVTHSATKACGRKTSYDLQPTLAQALGPRFSEQPPQESVVPSQPLL
jgi:hypothetical protein